MKDSLVTRVKQRPAALLPRDPPAADAEFWLWMTWAVAQFPMLREAPQPMSDLELWRSQFSLWAARTSRTTREVCRFLLQFSHARNEFSDLRTPDYSLHLALVNLDENNRRGLCRVITFARVY